MARNFYELLSNIIIFKYITQQQAMKAPHALIPWRKLAETKILTLCSVVKRQEQEARAR